MIAHAAAFIAGLASTALEPSRVIWRDARAPVTVGEVQDATEAGLLTASTTEGGKPQLVGWQRVRGVEGPMAGPAARFAADSDTLWRLERRVLRGDYRLAEELAEARYQRLTEKGVPSGPSAALMVEAALRCRLARGYSTGAILPALDLGAMVAAAGPGVEAWVGWTPDGLDVTDARWRSGPLVDRELLLCPFTPPAFDPSTPTRGLEALASGPAWARFEAGTPEAAAIAALYRFAARAAASPPAAEGELELPGKDLTHPGVKLVRWLLEARYGSDVQRKSARQALQARIVDEFRKTSLADASQAGEGEPAGVAQPRWVEAWCRLGIGLSLVRERDAASRRLGIVHLLHVPARFGDAYPGLAAVALGHASAALAAEGDRDGAAKLRMEIDRLDPTVHAPVAAPALPPAR